MIYMREMLHWMMKVTLTFPTFLKVIQKLFSMKYPNNYLYDNGTFMIESESAFSNLMQYI